MTLLHDKERRDALRQAKAAVRDLERPEREARKIQQAQRRAQRERRPPKVEHERAKPKGGRERDNTYLAALRGQRCCVGPIMGDPCEGRTDPAHIRFSDHKAGRTNPGMGAKSDDRWCLPVCRKHHEAQHAYGDERKWWAVEVGADPTDLARDYYRAHETDGDFEAVLRRYTKRILA